ncbi:MAG: Uma2 family endonuclease [Leptolyngbya sp. Prado105]|jgi:Uma2 family endonuclease|nr:Uma2 family endonuclease [Leptolyngbya sp. Prado105]
MTQAKLRFNTIEEYLNYNDDSDRRYELVQGELSELPTENPQNLLIAAFLLIQFAQIGIPAYRLGIKHQIAVDSAEVTAREPDLTVHSEESATAILQQKQAILRHSMPVPMLVVEVVSPGEPGTENYDRDYIDKRKEYAARGIPEYWLVDPSCNVVVILELRSRQYTEVGQFSGVSQITSPTFPALQLTAEEILKGGK